MRRVFVFVLLATTLLAQQVETPSSPFTPTPPSGILPGTEFLVEVRREIKASKAKLGDPVEFRTLSPVLVGNKIVVPSGASLRGAIVSANRNPATLRFTIHLLGWKKNVVRMNGAVVRLVRRKFRLGSGHFMFSPTRLEGVEVAYTPGRLATTLLTAPQDVVLHRGTLLYVRHFDPEAEPTQ